MDEQKGLVLFEKNSMTIFKQLSQLKKDIKALEKAEMTAKESLKKAMAEYGITSFSNEFVTISSVKAGEDKVSFDEDAFALADPETYKELCEDYPNLRIDLEQWKELEPETYAKFLKAYNKVTKGKSGYIRIEAK